MPLCIYSDYSLGVSDINAFHFIHVLVLRFCWVKLSTKELLFINYS